MKKLLRFMRQMKPIGKTEAVEVYSTHSDDFLGIIHWRCGWRCYVMSYAENIEMSASCHDELNDYMKELEVERKKRLKNENQE